MSNTMWYNVCIKNTSGDCITIQYGKTQRTTKRKSKTQKMEKALTREDGNKLLHITDEKNGENIKKTAKNWILKENRLFRLVHATQIERIIHWR